MHGERRRRVEKQQAFTLLSYWRASADREGGGRRGDEEPTARGEAERAQRGTRILHFLLRKKRRPVVCRQKTGEEGHFKGLRSFRKKKGKLARRGRRSGKIGQSLPSEIARENAK